MRNRPIGLLDSGVGGLTVLKAAQYYLPNESFVYIGDTARCPYGNRRKEEIISFTLELVDFLISKNVKMIVMACNTATAHALKVAQDYADIPVIGVISPGSEAAAKKTVTGEIGLLATQSTVNSKLYKESINELNAAITVKSLACPEFVTLVENNSYKSAEAKQIVNTILEPFKTDKMDTLILGCTHFPLLKPFIQDAMGKEVTLIDSGSLTAIEIKSILKDNDFIRTKGINDSRKTVLYTTGQLDLFTTITNEWLETDNIECKRISLERLVN